jgi:hypothetical protein
VSPETEGNNGVTTNGVRFNFQHEVGEVPQRGVIRKLNLTPFF